MINPFTIGKSIRIICLGGLAMVLIFCSTRKIGAQPAKQNRHTPNIIYIYADDLGYGELGCYGQQKINTPNLDRMAKEGMRFTQHYTSTPVCAPARAMLLTGVHAGHSIIRGNHELGGFADSAERGQMPLPGSTFTVAQLLKQKGYTTAMVGKWGLGMHNTIGSPLKHGFDYYYGYLDQKQAHNYFPSHLWENDVQDTLHQPWINVHKKLDPITATEADFDYFKGKYYAPALMTEKALQFIDKHTYEPFFLYLPYTLPHLSLQVPNEELLPYIGQFEEQPYYGQKGYASTKFPLSTYAAMITYLDKQVGIILQKLKKLGLDENTIVFFSSDNGSAFSGGVDATFFNSAAGLRGLKMDLYEGGIRMPFIARWPGKIPAGSTSDLLSVQYDFFATVADLTKQKISATDGISFLPELLGKPKKQQKHPFLYFEFSEKSGQVAIRMGDWKGVKSNLKKNSKAPWELYNLSEDLQEANDVAAMHPDIIKQLDAILLKEHTHAMLPAWDFVDGFTKQQKQYFY